MGKIFLSGDRSFSNRLSYNFENVGIKIEGNGYPISLHTTILDRHIKTSYGPFL